MDFLAWSVVGGPLTFEVLYSNNFYDSESIKNSFSDFINTLSTMCRLLVNVPDSVATFQDPLFRESKVEYIMPTSPLQHKWLLQSHFDSVYIKENIKLHHLQNIYEFRGR